MRKFFIFHIFCFVSLYSIGQSITPAGPINLCTGATQELFVQGLAGDTTIQWQKDGVDIPGANKEGFLVATTGDYRVKYSDDKLTPVVKVVINLYPEAAFTSSFIANQCSNETVTFTNTSTGAATFLWDFGDLESGIANNTSSQKDPKHTFIGVPGNATQTFKIRLTATSAAGGCINKDSITISPRQIPDGKMGGTGAGEFRNNRYFKICGNVPSGEFIFSNQSGTNTSNLNYSINWGNGTPDFFGTNYQTLTNTYTIGTHKILLTINGGNGCKSTTEYYAFVGTNPAVGLANPGNTAVCSGEALTFPITETGNNIPGTIYTLTFTDGSAPKEYVHPAVPAFEKHSFEVTSCGTNSSDGSRTYKNSFSASIQASNPCASSSASIVPIYVTEKPKAEFSIAPKDTICINTKVTLTNNSKRNIVDNGNCYPGNSIWTITPSTGWTITRGVFGNDYNSLIPSVWQTGSDELDINFTAAGVYTIRLKTGSDFCGIDETLKTICVNLPPTGAFTVDKNIGCGPLTVAATATSSIPTCGVMKFIWSVDYESLPGCAPGEEKYNFLSGTTINSQNPVIQFTNPGIYSLGLTIINPGGACSTVIARQKITIKSKPVIQVNGIGNEICQNSFILPKVNTTCTNEFPPTYLWTFEGGLPANSEVAEPGKIIYDTPGKFPVKLIVTNDCGTDTYSSFIKVDPTPDLTLPSDLSLCNGSSSEVISFTTIPSGAIISWTNNNPGIGLSYSGTSGTISSFKAINTSQMSVNARINVLATLGNCNDKGFMDITVFPKPQRPAGLNVEYCQNEAALPLKATPASGNTLLWYVSTSGGAGVEEGIIPNTAVIGSENYYVSQVSALGKCESERVAISVKINAIPKITSHTPISPDKCGAFNGEIILKGLTALATYEIFYKQDNTSKLISLKANSSGEISLIGLPKGRYTDLYVKLNGCISASIAEIELVDPTRPEKPLIVNVAPICSGSDITLSATSVTPGVAYIWTTPFGTKINEQNPIIKSATLPKDAGNYSVVATKDGCTSETAAVNAIIHPTPKKPELTVQTICSGNNLELKSTTSFAGDLNYSWTGPGVFTSELKDPVRLNAAKEFSGEYTLIVTSVIGGCISEKASISPSVYQTPGIEIEASNGPAECKTNTGSITIKGLEQNKTYPVSYTKDGLVKTENLTSNSDGKIIIKNLSAGRYDHIYVTNNGCKSNELELVILNDPNPPAIPSVIQDVEICEGEILKLKADITSASPVTYNWTGPQSWNNTVQNPEIKETLASMSGDYYVTVTINNCISEAAVTKVIINPKPAIPVIAGNTPLCTGSILQLNAETNFSSDLIYTWRGPDNFTSSLKNIEISSVEVKDGGDYSLILTSVKGGCQSGVAVKHIDVNQTPSIKAIPSDPSECNKSNGSITITGLKSAELYFVNMLMDGNPMALSDLTANGNNEIVISNLSKGTYTQIHVIYKGCPSNKLEIVVLKDPNSPLKPAAGEGMALCVGTKLDLKASSSEDNVSYSWRGPNGFLSNFQSPSILDMKPENAGSYFVKVIQSNCVSEESEVIIVVDKLPLPPSIIPISYCIDAPAVPLSVTFPPGNIIKWYSEMIGGTGSTDAPVPSTLEVGTKAYYMTQTDNNSCESAIGTLIVTVNPNAVADYKPITPINCPPFVIGAGDIDLKKYPNNNREYAWYADDVLIGSGDFPGYTIEDADKSVAIKLKTISAFGCKADSLSHTFSTYKVPKPSFTLSVNDGCGPLTVKIENTTPEISFFKYNWDFGNGQISNLVQPDEMIFMPNPKSGDTTYYVSLKIITECEMKGKILPVQVKSKPIALFTPTITEGCSPMKVTFKNISKGFNITYHWDFGDGKTFDTNIPEEVQHTFYAGTVTNYTVRLTSTNECGEDYSEFIITVAPNQVKLNFAMNGPDHFGCQPHTVNFFNNSSGASAYFWDFGDGNFRSSTLGVETVAHTYLIPGKYEVKLVASNSCSDTTTTDYVTIYPGPKAAFIADRYTSCKGDKISFANQSESGTSYLWTFGDGSTSTLADPEHLYTVPGIYTVGLTVYKLNGPGSTCTDFIEKQVQIVDTLPGLFTMSDSKTDCGPLTVTFENANLPAVTSFWDFGDGATGSGDRVIHTYKYSGTYTVTLNTTSPGGCNYVSTQIVEVNGPSGTLQYGGGFACSPAPVRLEVMATNTNTYQWDFGDGVQLTTSQGVIFHEYTKPGTYLPSLTLLNNAGCNYFIRGKDSIKIDKVEAGFIAVQDRKCGSTNVIFTDTSHVFFGIKSVQWNFGEGIIKEGKSVNHTYNVSGKYWIEMIVTGNLGCAQTVRRQVDVQVYNTPAVAMIAEVSKCTNQWVLFKSVVQSEDALNTYRWSISNGVTGTGENFNYMFVQPGTYQIDLTVSTVNSCSATSRHTIEIKPSPVVKASGDVTICLGNTIQLNASGAVQYQWTPLQGLSCNTCPNPMATPGISTPYIVEGLNNIGCPGYDTVNVTVIPPLKMTSSENDSICIGQSANLRVNGAASYQWTPAQTLSSSTVANPVAKPVITTGYRVVGYDGHNCFTDTAFIIVAVGKYPTVSLGDDRSLSTGTILPLATIVTDGPVKDWKWTPSIDLDCATCPLPNAHIKKDISYQVEITNNYGCTAKDEISIKVFCENSQVFIPNAFTPDGDGMNDILMVRGKGIVTVKSFRIFNRWGQLVFERNNFPPNEPSYGWNGKVAGKAGPSEVYVYTAEVICENGVPFTYKGNTTLIK